MKHLLVLSLLFPLAALAADSSGRDAFLRQQAYGEMTRLSGQVDALQTHFDSLAQRVSRLEGQGGDDRALRAEIASLQAALAELRKDMRKQREEIVRDLSSRLAKMQPKTSAPAASPAPRTSSYSGPTDVYVVQNGDSLYLISKAFHTTIAVLRELNGIQGDRLSIGQKLVVPHVDE